MSIVSSFGSRAAFWAAPRFCLLCGLPVDPGEVPDLPLCPDCAAGLRPIEGPRCSICGKALISEFDTCFACRAGKRVCTHIFPIFDYRGEISALIRAYKEGHRPSLAPFWAGLMEKELRSRWPGWVLAPVPPRPEKLAMHIWDQVEAIASCLERRGIEVIRPLKRAPSSQQKLLSRQDRSLNALKSYSLSPQAPEPLPDRIVLIDDVYTTGATIEACAKALLAGGVTQVSALVLAAD
ncbi:MAG: ComF family protein [Spirochaetes bacterium]|nr:ComF family protein [Spirochaetota bacterium]